MTKQKRDDSVPIWLYIVGLGLLIYLFLYVFKFTQGWLGDMLVMQFMQFATIGLHEGSHLVTMALNMPRIVVIAAGTGGQIGFVLLCLGVALWKKAYFVAAFMGLWLSYSLQNTAIYMLDAKDRVLQLISPIPGADPQEGHDWFNMFREWGLMPHYKLIGDVTMAIGFGVGVMAICFGAYAIVRLYKIRRAAPTVPLAEAKAAIAIKLKNAVDANGKQTGARDELFDRYAAMMVEYGALVTSVHLHKAWQEWAARYDAASPYRTLYSLLPQERKAYYDGIVAATGLPSPKN